MAINVESTELDYNSIRNKLKTYFEQSDEFQDYDFEASGLANILDVLAYNTHFNALVANMAINESFLETSQLRSSALTHAHSIGYTPRSRTASEATIKLTADLSTYVGSRPNTISISSGKKFNCSIEGVTYTFQTRQIYSAVDDGFGIYNFTDAEGSVNLKVYEGTPVTRSFLVPAATDSRTYVIADPNMDTDTVEVKVYANPASTDYATYTDIKNAVSIDNQSKYYQLREAPNGYYELSFGVDTLLGDTPAAGNKIVITYLTVNGKDANGAKVFTPQSGVTVGGQTFTLTSTTVTKSIGGADKENISSIQYHAPLGYASQNRMVTATDYHTLIQAKYPEVEDVTAWGGQDNIPIDFGTVYVSLKFPDGTTEITKAEVKNSITNNLIAPLSTLSISPKFVDPVVTYLKLSTTFDFNPTLSGVTVQTMTDNIDAAIANYFSNNLNQFRSEFRRSNLLTVIDELSPAVLSSRMDVIMGQDVAVRLNYNSNYTVYFPTILAGTDDVNYTISSERFIYQNNICTIRNKLNTYNLEVVTSSGQVLVNNIGTFVPGDGAVNLVSFQPESIIGGGTNLRIYAKPGNQATIKPLRNYIISLDTDSLTRGVIDYQTVRISL